MAASKQVGQIVKIMKKISIIRLSAGGCAAVPRVCVARRSFCSQDDGSAGSDASAVQLPRPVRKNRKQQELLQHQPVEEQSVSLEDVPAELVSAASEAASAVGGDKQRTMSDLLTQLQAHQGRTHAQKHGQPPPRKHAITDMLSGLKTRAERGPPRRQGIESEAFTERRQGSTTGRAPNTSGRMQRPPRQHNINIPNLFEGPALGIFHNMEHVPAGPATLFDEIEAEQIQSLADFPPENAFDEMIKWTKEGKMWRYPIDNEQGWEEERDVAFHEHVFLDGHLHGFPDMAPVRHFMELVAVGLSKNPHMSVHQKIAHIDWFRDYFKEKKPILDEYMRNASIEDTPEEQAKIS